MDFAQRFLFFNNASVNPPLYLYTMKKVRLRFAPSPTGGLHLGGVRTALYNYLYAKKHKGDFVLRIEDTDQSRYVAGAEQYINDCLNWCGIQPNEGPHHEGEYAPYRQSERKNLYKQYAEELVKKGHAYYAFDTPEEIEAVSQSTEKNVSLNGLAVANATENIAQTPIVTSVVAPLVIETLEANATALLTLRTETREEKAIVIINKHGGVIENERAAIAQSTKDEVANAAQAPDRLK